MNRILRATLSILASALLLAGCAKQESSPESLCGLRAEDFQTQWMGQDVDLYTLRNSSGMEVQITNFGASIVSIVVPDKNGTNFYDRT